MWSIKVIKKNYVYGNSHWRCSVRKGVLRNFAKSTGKHLCQSLFFNKVAGLGQFFISILHVGYLLMKARVMIGLLEPIAEVYLEPSQEPSQQSKMERFVKKVKH